MLRLIHAPNQVLSEIAKPVEKIDKPLIRLIENMQEALLAARDPEGVGLAAPQVGKSIRLFLVKQTPRAPVSVYINPELVVPEKKLVQKKGKKKDNPKKLEGCLSLPNIWGEVMRYPQITMRYMDEKGSTHMKTFRGFLATIMQHEYDHIQGILFPKRVLEQNGQLYKSRKNENGEDVFEEISI